MNQLSIQRNPETKQLEVCIAFKDNLSVSFPVTDRNITALMVKSTCQAADIPDDFFALQFLEQYDNLMLHSKYRAKMMLDLNVDINSNYVFYKLICNGILTMNEIYWFDWYVKKHKLVEVKND